MSNRLNSDAAYVIVSFKKKKKRKCGYQITTAHQASLCLIFHQQNQIPTSVYFLNYECVSSFRCIWSMGTEQEDHSALSKLGYCHSPNNTWHQPTNKIKKNYI